MTIFSALPMNSFGGASPTREQTSTYYNDLGEQVVVETGLENPWFNITVTWTWPVNALWSKFRLVRSVRSPATRIEEGRVMIETTKDAWLQFMDNDPKRPKFVDPQPPPDEWVFYTAFCLDQYRVWTPAGSTSEIGTGNYGWSLRLPDLLPGAAVSPDYAGHRGVSHPSDLNNDLTQFLQAPGFQLDRAVTVAESVQYYWNPKMCAPQALPHLARSFGYRYDESVGMGRIREIVSALRKPSQGSLEAIRAIAESASGSDAHARIGHNWMLDINDSSFESGNLADTGWAPSSGLAIQVFDATIATPVLPPEVQAQYCMYIPTARRIACGSYTTYDATGNVEGQVFDPIIRGIPIQDWSEVRMRANALDKSTSTGGNTLKMGLDLYDSQGLDIETLTVVSTRELIPGALSTWDWYGNQDGRGTSTVQYIPIPKSPETDILPSDVLTNVSLWNSTSTGYDGPQSTPPLAETDPYTGMLLRWNPSASTSVGKAFRGLSLSNLKIGAKYRIIMSAISDSDESGWAVSVANKALGNVCRPVEDGDSMTSEVEWVADSTTASIGMEVFIDGADWTDVGDHLVVEFNVIRQNTLPAYGVPWLEVGKACYVDLIMVDGR